MSHHFTEAFLPEFDHEMRGTRGILEIVPDRLLKWQAHDSLHTICWVASHLADTLSWADVTVNEVSFDVAPVGGEPYQTPELESAAEIVKMFDANLQTARSVIAKATDEQLAVPFALMQGGEEIASQPRSAWVKTLFINHMVHHRAFLVAYLRMNDITCPALYG